MKTETILVTGGTGSIGSAFVGMLGADARRPIVRVATRNVDSPAARLLAAMSPETVHPVHFDVEDTDSLRAAFEGVTRLFVIAPFVADIGAWHEPIATAAAEAGTVGHIVKSSVTGARAPDSDPPPGRIPSMHFRGEELLRGTGIPTTVVRPTMYMQHFLTVPPMYTRGEDRFHFPIGDARVALLDCRDIAAFAAALLLAQDDIRAEHAGRASELTGPAAMGAEDLATILGWVARRPFTHVDGEEAFVDRAKAVGAPDTVKFIYREAAGGWFAKVEYPGFEEVTGRTPTSFATFALDHAAHFRGP